MSDPMTTALWFLRAVGIAGPAAHVSVAAAYSHVAEVVALPSGLPPSTCSVVQLAASNQACNGAQGKIRRVPCGLSARLAHKGLECCTTRQHLPPRAA